MPLIDLPVAKVERTRRELYLVVEISAQVAPLAEPDPAYAARDRRIIVDVSGDREIDGPA